MTVSSLRVCLYVRVRVCVCVCVCVSRVQARRRAARLCDEPRVHRGGGIRAAAAHAQCGPSKAVTGRARLGAARTEGAAVAGTEP